ncbi:hypothetical protein Tdes44962_MAKER07332 [Teratosphaeria destructans]|uniref:Uncharacterized protein n=1 Tax=Teratosphaeria destructans TaxID=418781 RepID=A0A9W7SZW2_9PEZI|nr:hypothetical protein Tdes44962_MAKER07332 [Teratosphaeria destructans]
MEMLKEIHDFFMGIPRPPYLVSAAIKDIAEQIALYCSRRRLTSVRPRKLISELFDLAAEVRDGQWSRGAMDTLGRGRRRGGLLGYRRDPRAIGWYEDEL